MQVSVFLRQCTSIKVSESKPVWGLTREIRIELCGTFRRSTVTGNAYETDALDALRKWETDNKVEYVRETYRGRGRTIRYYDAENGAKVIAWLESQDFHRVGEF